MHFLDAWTALPLLDLVRLALPAGLVFLAIFMPGRFSTRGTCGGVALTLPFLRELGAPWWVVTGWVLLWAALAWQSGRAVAGAKRPAVRFAGFESGSIGLLLAPALLAALLAAVARLDLDAELTRRASYGALLLGLGFLHLMLRGHIARAAMAFATLGLGLQVLGGALRDVVTEGRSPSVAMPLVAAALAAALAVRIGRGRAEHAGSTWVRDAHELHD